MSSTGPMQEQGVEENSTLARLIASQHGLTTFILSMVPVSAGLFVVLAMTVGCLLDVQKSLILGFISLLFDLVTVFILSYQSNEHVSSGHTRFLDLPYISVLFLSLSTVFAIVSSITYSVDEGEENEYTDYSSDEVDDSDCAERTVPFLFGSFFVGLLGSALLCVAKQIMAAIREESSKNDQSLLTPSHDQKLTKSLPQTSNASMLEVPHNEHLYQPLPRYHPEKHFQSTSTNTMNTITPYSGSYFTGSYQMLNKH